MEKLQEIIRKEINNLEKMILSNSDKEKIIEQRKKIDKLLEKYIKDL